MVLLNLDVQDAIPLAIVEQNVRNLIGQVTSLHAQSLTQSKRMTLLEGLTSFDIERDVEY